MKKGETFAAQVIVDIWAGADERNALALREELVDFSSDTEKVGGISLPVKPTGLIVTFKKIQLFVPFKNLYAAIVSEINKEDEA